MTDQNQIINELRAELEAQRARASELECELLERRAETAELRQRLEIRNLSLERLQAQFTVAAEAVNQLLAEREKVRNSRWAKLGAILGFLPRLEDNL